MRLRDGFLMAETCKVAVIWVSRKDDSHFEKFAIILDLKLPDIQRSFLSNTE